MNKNDFKYKFNLWVYIVIPITAILTLPTIFFNFANIFGWFDRFTTTLFTDIFVIILGFFVIFMCIYTLLFSKYKLTENTLSTHIAFFSSKIALGNIKQIVYYKDTHFLIIFYNNKENNLVFTKIAIKNEDEQPFIDKLLELNPAIALETENINLDNIK